MTLIGSPPVLLTPPTESLLDALESTDVETIVVEEPTGDALAAADLDAVGTMVLTDVSEATAVPIVKDHNPAVTVVVYASGTIPTFARPQADLIVDPALVDAATLAEEIAAQAS